MKRTAYMIVAGVGLVLLGLATGQWIGGAQEISGEESKAFKKMERAYKTIRKSYVTPVQADSLAHTSIEGMLEPLDQYSTYISPQRMKRVEERFSGSFEGIGVTYELIDGPNGQDTIGVVSVVPKGPSAKAGIRAGDRIVEVGGTSAIGWSHQRIQEQLKGPEGSTVKVGLRRPTTSDRVYTTITRAKVPLETLEAAYVMGERTGYLRLSRFAQTTHQELTDGLRRLESEGMDRLILDLRGNTGGLMSAAEEVADEFLVDEQLIVTARSRHEEYGGARYATGSGLYEKRPLIVLVDEHSASASEIVAGALQDHDRAVLVGQRTFGKGFVQRQFDLDDGSSVRLTIARFYTPSGRRVQRLDPSPIDTLSSGTGTLPDTASAPDSVLHRTDAGRRIIGGGGIWPDQVITTQTPGGEYRIQVEGKGLIRDFARQWMDARADSLRAEWDGRPTAFLEEFSFPSSVYPAFVGFAAEHGVRRPERAEVEAVRDRGPRMESTNGPQIDPNVRSVIETLLKSEVGQRLFGSAMAIRIRNRVDPDVVNARQSWAAAAQRAEQYPVQE